MTSPERLASVSVPVDFLGMHYNDFSGGAPTPSPTYSPQVWRTHSAGVDWSAIEISDNNFDWSRMDDLTQTFAGQSIYYQIYGTPAHARDSGAAWTTVPDQDGVVGAGCVPDQAKLARFVTALLTRYPQIKWISPWNEPKAGGNAVVRFTGATTGSVSAGQTVTQVTTGATGTVLSNSGTSLVVELNGPAYSETAFNASNQIRVDGSNYFTPTQQAAVSYWFGTLDELVTTSRAVYAAAKAANPAVLVTTPDFVEGANVSGENEWLATWIDAGGSGSFDVVAYHFYNYEIRAATKTADAYSIIERCDAIDAVLQTRGISAPKIASECGYTSGWNFYSQINTDKTSQAATLRRVTAYLASRGWIAVIWYNHTDDFCGNPASYATIANALDWCGKLAAKSISAAHVRQDNSLHLHLSGVAVAV